MKIIAISNLKGGVGKTSICSNIAGVLAERGQRVLLVDLDKQANLSEIYLPEVETDTAASDGVNLAAVFFRKLPLRDIIRKTGVKGISIAPADPDLVDVDSHFASDLNGYFILAEVLNDEKKNFDYVLIDCPPDTNMATRMALVAAHGYVIPMDAHRFAYKGMERLQDLVRDIRKRANPDLKLLGCVLSRIQSRRALTDRYVTLFREKLGRDLMPTEIRESIKFQEASASGKPITAYQSASEWADLFRQLVKDLRL